MYEKEVHATEGTRELYYINTPSGISAILESTSSYDSIFYIHTDILSSYDVITDDQGSVRERLSFDPWGRRRNTSSWDYTGVPASFKFDRGFTGHEHLDDFSLINMNGRMYDPIMAMFLSPDPFIQSPHETQNFNRYAYVMNNPLKFIDPSGMIKTRSDFDTDEDWEAYQDYIHTYRGWMNEMYGEGNYWFRGNPPGTWGGPGVSGGGIGGFAYSGGSLITPFTGMRRPGPGFNVMMGNKWRAALSHPSVLNLGSEIGALLNNLSVFLNTGYVPVVSVPIIICNQVGDKIVNPDKTIFIISTMIDAIKEGGTYSIDAAVNWLNENSYSSYSAAKAAGAGAACARYIRYSLEAGLGLKKDALLNKMPVPARLYGPFLEYMGFRVESTTKYIRGDIAVIQGYPGGTSDANGIPYGHI